jgi:hypothetical protein
MDRVVERIYGPDASFIGVLSSERGSVEAAMDLIRGKRGVCLRLLKIDRTLLSRAVSSCGAPNSSSRRWVEGVPYPRQMTTLDRICRSRGHGGWIEATVSADPALLGHPVPTGALLCLVADIVESGGVCVT